MDKTPHSIACITYSDPNKKNLREWIKKTFLGTMEADHCITVGDIYLGFWVKAGTLYYATIIYNKDRQER